VLYPLVVGLLGERPPVVRSALAPVLAAPGTTASRALRAELLDVLLEEERDASVLEAVVRAARIFAQHPDARTCPANPAPSHSHATSRAPLLVRGVRRPEGEPPS
ncbi:hypothetical protein ACFVIB_28785, partial [Streptomyces nigra]|uniref:hypothetical protein n=1 Tax=Streptomyces nigra TaxID=1827580 RepID=UPI0036305A60